jgi:hypothetical protein
MYELPLNYAPGFGRGGGRGGFQQRDIGPPDTVLGIYNPAKVHFSSR